MAWDEPGKKKDKDKKSDPWGGRGNDDLSKQFDEAIGRLKKKFNRMMSGGTGGGDDEQKTANFGLWGLGLIVIVVLAIWVVAGFYTVQTAEQGVVLRFGKYATTTQPGLHWIPRLIDKVFLVNTQKIYTYSYDASMLTTDENIVNVAVTVFYRVNNPEKYLFRVSNPVNSLQQATASALRQVIGQTTLDNVLTVGREAVREETRVQLEKILKRYNTGIEVTQVALQQAKAPEEVKAAFDDAIKAQEDEKRYANEAQAYAMKVVPIAKGQAKRIVAEANAYKQQVVLGAQAEIASFLAILPEYKKAPQVTRERLYLSAMENVLNDSTKILVDQSKSNNLLYLPLDKLLQASTKLKLPRSVTSMVPKSMTTSTATTDDQKNQALLPEFTNTTRPSRQNRYQGLQSQGASNVYN